MAFEYFLYDTGYTNTLVARSKTSFAPSPPYKEIYIDYFIPEIQPLVYYRESGGTIVLNSEAEINDYIQSTSFTGSTSPEDTVYQFQFTGYTATTKPDIDSRVYRSGDTMTGTLCTTSNLLASGAVTGSSLSASVVMNTPILNASTSISAPQITGSTCITSPISCATTRMQAPVVCGGTCVISPITIGSTCVCSPTVCGSVGLYSPAIYGSAFVTAPTVSGVTTYAGSCLCSLGTTRLIGATAASTLNVSGATTLRSTLNVSGITRINNTLYLDKTPTIAEATDYTLFWDPATKEIQARLTSGGSTNYYYAERLTVATTTSTTPVKYLGFTGTSMPVGSYQVDFTEQVGQATTNNCVFGRITINGVTQGSDFLLKMNVNNFTFTNTLSRDISLPAGTNCFDMYFWNGGGTACATFGSIRIRKV